MFAFGAFAVICPRSLVRIVRTRRSASPRSVVGLLPVWQKGSRDTGLPGEDGQ
jgi:hypothetical protein